MCMFLHLYQTIFNLFSYYSFIILLLFSYYIQFILLNLNKFSNFIRNNSNHTHPLKTIAFCNLGMHPIFKENNAWKPNMEHQQLRNFA